MTKPTVSVVMSVYNGQDFLNSAIDSILTQTFDDFEFIIINDASTDASMQIVKSYSDSRIKIVNNEKNLGLTKSLNNGLEIAQGKYIARMDCDDISCPTRLERQVAFMDSNREVGVSGTWAKTIGGGRSYVIRPPSQDLEVKASLLFNSPLIHPSVIMRREVLEKFGLHYNPSFDRAEDYEFWARCSEYFPILNIEEVLLYYRVHHTQISSKFKSHQNKTAGLVRANLLNKLAINLDDNVLDLHNSICSGVFSPSMEFVKQAEDWLLQLIKANSKISRYEEKSFLACVGERWFITCYNSTVLGRSILRIYWDSPLSKWNALNYELKMKFFVKAFTKR